MTTVPRRRGTSWRKGRGITSSSRGSRFVREPTPTCVDVPFDDPAIGVVEGTLP